MSDTVAPGPTQKLKFYQKGTLTVGNNSGKVADKDLHNSVLVTQASMFSKVMDTADWIKKLDEK